MLKLLANDGILRRIVESAAAAPSIHNTQPWQFTVVADDLLEVRADPGRTLWVGDPRARALYLSCGAALFNIRTAIRMLSSGEAATVLDMAAQASTELANDIDHRIELRRWIATNSSGDGIPADALPSRPSREPAPVRGDLSAASPAAIRPTADYEKFPQLAVLTTGSDEPADWIRAG